MHIGKKRIICAVLLQIIVVIIALSIQAKIISMSQKNQSVLDKDWQIQLNDKDCKETDLSKFSVPNISVGDKICITRNLGNTDDRYKILQIYTRYCAIQVYVNKKRIYTYGQDAFNKGDIIGSGYQWIELPKNYNGNELKIVYCVGENNAFKSFDEIKIKSPKNIYSDLIIQFVITGMIACCMLIIGGFSIAYVLLVTDKDSRFQMLFWLGAFSIFVSMWMITSSRIIEFVSNNLSLNCYLEYISMYAACLSILFFTSLFFNSEKMKKVIKFNAYIYSALSAIAFTLNITNIKHFPKTLLFFHIAAVISAILIIVSLFMEYKEHKNVEKAFFYGIISFFICVILEFARYRYNKLCAPSEIISQSIMPIGASIFAVAMFSSFFFKIMEHVAEEMEKKVLYDMAFQDSLTGIHNRAWCEKIMNEYSQQKKPVSIINLDLNLFKEVNDTYGHAIGDDLLINFSRILLENFNNNECVGRMGGDEFVVISEKISDEELQKKINSLVDKIDEANSKNNWQYKISVSYGYASDSDNKIISPWKIYEKADAYMYKFKKNSRMARR